MKQTPITIRTLNFPAMRDFYRDQLRLKLFDDDSEDSISFKDFKTELFLSSTSRPDEVCAEGTLRFISFDASAVADGLRQRGVPLRTRKTESGDETYICDPDGNMIQLVNETEE